MIKEVKQMECDLCGYYEEDFYTSNFYKVNIIVTDIPGNYTRGSRELCICTSCEPNWSKEDGFLTIKRMFL